eukprot:263763_1
MSFSMHQWKSDDEKDGKWSSNYMHFSYLQNDELWVEFDIPNTLLMIPKKWTEVATTPIIHNEMVSYNNTGRTTIGIDCTEKDFEGDGKLKSYVTGVIGGEWKSTKKCQTMYMSNGQFGKLFKKKYLKNTISESKSFDVEDGYSYLRFNGAKKKIYLSVNVVENVGGVIMKGSQKKRDEIKTKIRKEKQKATRAAKGNKKTK